jgi:glutaconate CoA-transferase subunit B
MEPDYTINEMLACVIARDLNDGDQAIAGANALVPRAAIFLAHFHHGPNMRVMGTNVFDFPRIQVGDTAQLFSKYNEYNRRHEEGFDRKTIKKGGTRDAFFFGGIQFDKYGNINMFGVGKDYKHLKFRGPGVIGLANVCTHIRRMYLWATDHTKRRFVEKLDYISAIGFGDGPDFRRKWGLPGGGPRWCISPIAIMDFDEQTKRMRLKSVHPGVTVDRVVENTGFELIIPEKVPTTDPPTSEELHILRTRVDPDGALRK